MTKKYNYLTGVTKVKTKLAIAFSTLGVGAAGIFGAASILGTAHADSSNITFEPTTYHLGDINGQDGWSKTGSYDSNVITNSSGYASFGTQSLQISNAVTSGSFGDQTFSKSLVDEAGETDSVNGGLSSGVRQPHFEAQFDIASATKEEQPGMLLSVSPDRGDGARMSYLRFEDQANGIHVFFDDVTDPTHAINGETFNETDVATLSYTAPHTIKISMDFKDGPDNDVVKVFVDSSLVATGTSWEDYYRYDTESQGSPHDATLENKSRTVDSLLFRVAGDANSENIGNRGNLL